MPAAKPTMQSFFELLQQVTEQPAPLSREAACALMQQILADQTNQLPDTQIAAILGAFAVRGVTAAELAGFVDAMCNAAIPLDLTDTERAALVDTCGTGGDASGTFNISTGAALVAAAAGAKIAKHGNRSVTSRCGSADVLELLGVPVNLSPERAVACLRQTGFVFLFAPAMHPAMRRVQPLRRALGFRTIFNILGPLTNPAGARRQVMGVYAPELVPLVAEAMRLLGMEHGLVVHGASGSTLADSGGIDELSLSGPSLLAEVRDGHINARTFSVEESSLSATPLSALTGGDARQNAALLQCIFAGEPGPYRDIVLLNAAAALVVAGVASTFLEGIALAATAIDSGAVLRTLAALVEFGKNNATE
ncbi:MAG TPA: anthranilate phosphoribosyltransferase [Acidobacteriaceae bacterium]|nr:anthranilate phosphoribosyltransferase [Acidobacteriaceae bacterium]